MTDFKEILTDLSESEQHYFLCLGEQLQKLEQLMKAETDTELYLKIVRQYTTVHRMISAYVHQNKRDAKVDEFKQKQLDRMTGSGSELSPLERWLEGIGDDGDE